MNTREISQNSQRVIDSLHPKNCSQLFQFETQIETLKLGVSNFETLRARAIRCPNVFWKFQLLELSRQDAKMKAKIQAKMQN